MAVLNFSIAPHPTETRGKHNEICLAFVKGAFRNQLILQRKRFFEFFNEMWAVVFREARAFGRSCSVYASLWHR